MPAPTPSRPCSHTSADGVLTSEYDAIRKGSTQKAIAITGFRPQESQNRPARRATGTITTCAVSTVAVIQLSDPPSFFTYIATVGRIGAFARWKRKIESI